MGNLTPRHQPPPGAPPHRGDRWAEAEGPGAALPGLGAGRGAEAGSLPRRKRGCPGVPGSGGHPAAGQRGVTVSIPVLQGAGQSPSLRQTGPDPSAHCGADRLGLLLRPQAGSSRARAPAILRLPSGTPEALGATGEKMQQDTGVLDCRDSAWDARWQVPLPLRAYFLALRRGSRECCHWVSVVHS